MVSSMTEKLPSLVLYLISSVFTKRLNAIGISNLPRALKTFQEASKEERYKYLVALLQSSVVLSGLFNTQTSLIKVNAIWNICTAVKESIDARKEQESQETNNNNGVTSFSGTIKKFLFGSDPTQQEATGEDDSTKQQHSSNKSKPDENAQQAVKKRFFSRSKQQPAVEDAKQQPAADESDSTKEQPEATDSPNKSKTEPSQQVVKKRFFFGSKQQPAVEDSNKQQQDNPKKSKTEKAQHAVHKTKRILKGKRDSATDDVLWGVLQISLVFFGQTNLQAIGTAWIFLLLTILEEAVLNEKLSPKQKLRKVAWIACVGYMSGKLVY